MIIDTNRTWNDVLHCLQYTHTLSSRDVCKMLKVDRPWLNKYILPYLDTIYLSGYTPSATGIKRSNWLQIASIQLNDRPLHDSMWINEQSFMAFIQNSIVSVTRQTRRIPIELLVSDVPKFVTAYQMHNDTISFCKDEIRNGNLVYFNKMQKEIAEQKKVYMEHLSPKGQKLLKNGSTNIVRRAETLPTPAELPPIDEVIANWQAPHDEKSYGDTDESIYRRFFKDGYIKIELEFEDMSKKKSRKVYFLPDPEPVPAKYIGEYITVSEIEYQNFLHA